MCRYTALGVTNGQPSYNGDRILVGKFAYEFDDPQRWDVIVFKFPGDATTDAGPISSSGWSACRARRSASSTATCGFAAGEEPFQIARKPPQKLLAMLQPVFDNDYMPRIAECGWPVRWQPEPTADRQHNGGVEFRRLRDVPCRRPGGGRKLAPLPPSDAFLRTMESPGRGPRGFASGDRAPVDQGLHGLQYEPGARGRQHRAGAR